MVWCEDRGGEVSAHSAVDCELEKDGARVNADGLAGADGGNCARADFGPHPLDADLEPGSSFGQGEEVVEVDRFHAKLPSRLPLNFAQ